MGSWSSSKIIASAISPFCPSQLRQPEINIDLTLLAHYLRTFAYFFFKVFWSPISRRVKIRKSFDSEVILHSSC